MANLLVKEQKIFAENGTKGVFGSGQSGAKTLTNDPTDIQNAAYSTGWDSAVIDSKRFIAQEDLQGLQFVNTYQNRYIQQKGICEWISTMDYYANSSFCQSGGVIYQCIQDNTGQAPSSSPTYWRRVDYNDVKLTGNQTIGGNKTFTGNTTFTGSVINNVTFTGNITAPNQVDTNTAQTISGVKTFSVSPKVPTAATSSNDTTTASTALVDNKIKNASTTTTFMPVANNKINYAAGTRNAPANGVVYCNADSGWAIYTLTNNTTGVSSANYNDTSSYSVCRGWIPVAKGDSFTCDKACVFCYLGGTL